MMGWPAWMGRNNERNNERRSLPWPVSQGLIESIMVVKETEGDDPASAVLAVEGDPTAGVLVDP